MAHHNLLDAIIYIMLIVYDAECMSIQNITILFIHNDIIVKIQ